MLRLIVDNQIVPSKIFTQGMLLGAIALPLIAMAVILTIHFSPISDPYIQQVLAASGDINNGHAIFETNCAGCHGVEADGNVGPSLQDISKRRSKANLIQQVISGNTPPMPEFQPNIQEMADLLAYLEEL
jgi:mono/diheme cytochrome c family protein